MPNMTQITIHVPSRLKSYITAKVKEGFESAESFVLTLVEAELLQDAHATDILEGMTKKERAQLHAIVAERSKGPFQSIDPFDKSYWDSLRKECYDRAGFPRPSHA
jgi:hypothetical protein